MRYFENPYVGTIRLIDDQKIENFVEDVIRTMLFEQEVAAKNSRRDSLYKGDLGRAFILLISPWFKGAHGMTRAFDWMKLAKNSTSKKDCTLLCSNVGYLVLKLYYYHLNKDEKKVESYRSKIEEINIDKMLEKDENEVLYGRAGYLSAMALSQSLTNLPIYEKRIEKIVMDIIMDGLSHNNGGFSRSKCSKDETVAKIPVDFVWKWHNKEYLGAAHGYSGILYFILYYFDLIKLSSTDDILGSVHATIEKCLSKCLVINDSEWNLKSSIGTRDRTYDEELVHWCHGAPGWISLFCHPLIRNRTFCIPKHQTKVSGIEIAKHLGACVWKRGLLKKGLGLCHGIGGNGLALYSLYRATSDQIWLHRAHCFADFGIDNYDLLKNKPDNPNSLFQGLSGFTLFLSVLKDENLYKIIQTFPF